MLTITHLEIFEALKNGLVLTKRVGELDIVYKMKDGYIYSRTIAPLVNENIWFRITNINLSGDFEIFEQ